ncbi:PREDICTED: uncharacterized protein LOC108576958 [Habropoda laboriosa]|uniref:uncharacterized protein LOC108576958 n=1 Tax=Habropoda laboriosa TaxID=597456 RepID=UPI00083CB68C|nr:PREDICTED: uncharacterized protein LOC108576958 [Habropoda laboriosa]
MKNFAIVTCLLAATTVVRGIDQDNVIAKYMEYLMPEVKPCADEFHITEEAATNIQRADSGADMRQMGCLKACVMKRMGILTGLDFHMEPILKMIDVVHADNPADKDMVIKIANDCTAEIKGETDECNIGNKYTDCYVEKLFND